MALFVGDLGFGLALLPYASISAATTSGILASRLRQRAMSTGDVASGVLDGALLMVIAYVLGVVLLAAHTEVVREYGSFLAVSLAGLVGSVYFLPPAVIAGGLAGLAFRAVVMRGAV